MIDSFKYGVPVGMVAFVLLIVQVWMGLEVSPFWRWIFAAVSSVLVVFLLFWRFLLRRTDPVTTS